MDRRPWEPRGCSPSLNQGKFNNTPLPPFPICTYIFTDSNVNSFFFCCALLTLELSKLNDLCLSAELQHYNGVWITNHQLLAYIMTSVAEAAVTRQYTSPQFKPKLYRLPFSGYNFDDDNNENAQNNSNSRHVLRGSWMDAIDNDIDGMEVYPIDIYSKDRKGFEFSTLALDFFDGSNGHGNGAEPNENKSVFVQHDSNQQESIDMEIEDDFLEGKTRAATVVVVLLCC